MPGQRLGRLAVGLEEAGVRRARSRRALAIHPQRFEAPRGIDLRRPYAVRTGGEAGDLAPAIEDRLRARRRFVGHVRVLRLEDDGLGERIDAFGHAHGDRVLVSPVSAGLSRGIARGGERSDRAVGLKVDRGGWRQGGGAQKAGEEQDVETCRSVVAQKLRDGKCRVGREADL